VLSTLGVLSQVESLKEEKWGSEEYGIESQRKITVVDYFAFVLIGPFFWGTCIESSGQYLSVFLQNCI
jgi:hypothetical protein